jgi:hypothetical protein
MGQYCTLFSSERKNTDPQQVLQMNTALVAAEARHLTVLMLQVKLLYYIMHTAVGNNYKTANRMTLKFKISI